jgi:hypothetical protein
MPLQTVELLLLPRGEVKDKRSLERLTALVGDLATVGEVDERRVFTIEIEAEDLEAARNRVWNAVNVSITADNIKLLAHPDLPAHWESMSAPARP